MEFPFAAPPIVLSEFRFCRFQHPEGNPNSAPSVLGSGAVRHALAGIRSRKLMVPPMAGTPVSKSRGDKSNNKMRRFIARFLLGPMARVEANANPFNCHNYLMLSGKLPWFLSSYRCRFCVQAH